MESRVTPTGDRGAGEEGVDLSRRAFIGGTGAALVVTATAPAALVAGTPPSALEQSTGATMRAVPRTAISVTVNGAVHKVEVEDRWTLADLLRDHLQLTGTKLGC